VTIKAIGFQFASILVGHWLSFFGCACFGTVGCSGHWLYLPLVSFFLVCSDSEALADCKTLYRRSRRSFLYTVSVSYSGVSGVDKSKKSLKTLSDRFCWSEAVAVHGFLRHRPRHSSALFLWKRFRTALPSFPFPRFP
jgi:hypothetical protein